jgi:hypothetical protein
MTRAARVLIQLSIVVVFGGLALFWSGEFPLNPQQALISSAQAIIGRPLTPVSYAGVARRTTRRAVAAAPVYAAPVVVVAPVPVVVVPRTCVQAVDAYGRIYTRCY